MQALFAADYHITQATAGSLGGGSWAGHRLHLEQAIATSSAEQQPAYRHKLSNNTNVSAVYA
jgi:hypothetical protein